MTVTESSQVPAWVTGLVSPETRDDVRRVLASARELEPKIREFVEDAKSVRMTIALLASAAARDGENRLAAFDTAAGSDLYAPLRMLVEVEAGSHEVSDAVAALCDLLRPDPIDIAVDEVNASFRASLDRDALQNAGKVAR